MTQPPKWSQIPGPVSPREGSQQGQRVMLCPVFDAQRFEQELSTDRLIRIGSFGAVVVVVLFLQGSMLLANLWMLVLPLMIVWIFLSAPSARVMATLPGLTAALEQDIPAAEAMIAQSLARKPLHRQVRYELYHRLAIVRMGQQRWHEVVAIVSTLLNQPLGPASRHRPSLLLMLAEASMLQQDLHTSYVALSELAQPGVSRQLSLIERLQHLTIRTRYEVMLGHDGLALAGLPAKLKLVRMMPASTCGQMHEMWAIAAHRIGDKPLHDWMFKRAELLCEPAQFEAFRQGQLRFGPQLQPITPAMV